ncbi:hypothetical protein Goklo_008233 [Gossypium klotzschianum]|uniref:Uncharacterized protein n=1 Tax=Gossypium klotzschianum TaxID=34286 RepID=A0A7J8V003_9ROSI|nr:hypothetical protein [Gossypium klotzschianum]
MNPSIEFQKSNVDRYLQQLQPYTFIQEQTFDPLMRNCKGIWEIATEREWTNFYLPLEEPTIIPIVQEFYLALKEREAARPFYELRSFVKVRGVKFLFRNIDMEKILRFFTEGKEVWTYKTGITIPEKCNKEKGTFFLHLITELCKRIGVPMEHLDKEMNPPKKLLGDDMCSAGCGERNKRVKVCRGERLDSLPPCMPWQFRKMTEPTLNAYQSQLNSNANPPICMVTPSLNDNLNGQGANPHVRGVIDDQDRPI